MTQSEFDDYIDMYLIRISSGKLRPNTISAHIVLTLIETMRAEAEGCYVRMLEKYKSSGIVSYRANANYFSHAVAYLNHMKSRMLGSFDGVAVLRSADLITDILNGDPRHAAISGESNGKSRRGRNRRGKTCGKNKDDNAAAL